MSLLREDGLMRPVPSLHLLRGGLTGKVSSSASSIMTDVVDSGIERFYDSIEPRAVELVRMAKRITEIQDKRGNEENAAVAD